jgi:hypothetical protein
MAPKTKPQLEEENAALTAQVNSLQQQLGTVTAELGTVTAERNGLQARLVNIEADAVKLKASMETVSTGHFDSYRRITEHEAATAAKIASLEALVLRGPRERTWAERAETASADARRAPAVGTTTTQPESQAAQQRPQGRQLQHQHNHQHHQQQPQPGVATGKFVVHAPKNLTPDQALITVAAGLGCNTAAIHSVQKLSPITRSAAAPAPPAPAAAAPSTSAGALPPPPAPTNAVFVFTTTSDLAVLAVKGGLRETLKALPTPMWVDDHLTREEQLERKRREPERKQLRAAGVSTGWRKAALWMVVKIGDKDVWRIVPAAPAAAAAAAPPAALPAAPGTQPTGTLATPTS